MQTRVRGPSLEGVVGSPRGDYVGRVRGTSGLLAGVVATIPVVGAVAVVRRALRAAAGVRFDERVGRIRCQIGAVVRVHSQVPPKEGCWFLVPLWVPVLRGAIPAQVSLMLSQT